MCDSINKFRSNRPEMLYDNNVGNINDDSGGNKNMGGNIPGGDFLGWNFPGGNFPGGASLMGGNFPDENFPGGSFPDTI